MVKFSKNDKIWFRYNDWKTLSFVEETQKYVLFHGSCWSIRKLILFVFNEVLHWTSPMHWKQSSLSATTTTNTRQRWICRSCLQALFSDVHHYRTQIKQTILPYGWMCFSFFFTTWLLCWCDREAHEEYELFENTSTHWVRQRSGSDVDATDSISFSKVCGILECFASIGLFCLYS